MQALKQQCTSEVEAVRLELQHKQRQAARLLKATSEDEAIKVEHLIHAVHMSLCT